MPLPLILGTSSKYRISLFREHFPNHPFTTLTPEIDERAITAGYTDRSRASPTTLTLAIANAKADALLSQLPAQTVLLTSDQVVLHNNIIREKPSSAEECREYLRSYAEHPLVTVAAVVVTLPNGQRFEGTDVVTQHLQPIPETVIDQLVAKGDVLHCAGGITIEDALLQPYLGARTGTLESIMGLPVTLVERLLHQAHETLQK